MEPEQPDDRESRVRAALGLPGGPLPRVERRWLRNYHKHLTAHLRLPFAAHYTADLARVRESVPLVTVVALIDPGETSEYDGLVCLAHDEREQLRLSLVDIEVDADHPNFQLLDDYWYWFWNWRFDPGI
ncbi:MAG: hypothetical protein NTW96_19855 [Planctomycetia bacterium]|nr:hypothetical protein [Planctomycetia bacterium]